MKCKKFRLYSASSGASQVALLIKNLLVSAGDMVRSLGQEDSLEEGMATHSSILAWRSPWTEKPGRLQAMGLQRVRHNWSDLACRHSKQQNITRKLPADVASENRLNFRRDKQICIKVTQQFVTGKITTEFCLNQLLLLFSC